MHQCMNEWVRRDLVVKDAFEGCFLRNVRLLVGVSTQFLSVGWGRVPNQMRVARLTLVIKPRTSRTALIGV